MDEATVRSLLAQGAGPEVEFKERYSSRLLETIVAFANTRGGQILVGVDDKRHQIVSLVQPDREVEKVLNACRQAIDPPIEPAVRIVQLAEGRVVWLQVERTGRMQSKGGTVYVRHGRQTRRATAAEIRRLTLAETPEVYEKQPVLGATWADLDEDGLKEYFSTRAPRARVSGAQLRDLTATAGLAVREKRQLVPTIAGLLLFGKAPQRFNSNWQITALRFRGNEFDRDRYIDRRELSGTVDLLIEAGLQFVAGHMRILPQFLKEEATRHEVPEYPLPAVREALANAVAHRDYSVNERIQLRLFDNRLELQNPGTLLPDLTLDRVLQGRISRRRNDLISGVLRDKGYVEEVGFGLVFIRRQMRELGAPESRFEVTESHFTVTLPSRHAAVPWEEPTEEV